MNDTSPNFFTWVGERVRDLVANEESGQAMVEFVIIAPFQYVLIGAIIQFSLFNIAHIVVNHAAYKAARAALVADLHSDGPQIEAEEAAVFICSAIAGNEDAGGGQPIQFQGASETLALPRSPGAKKKTRVSIAYNDNEKSISATVTHEYELIVPVVRYMFFQDKSLSYSVPHATIQEVCYLPCPWTRKQ